MNAYELADELHKIAETLMPLHYITESVTMLRQQADRIAELEKSHIELEKGILKKLNQEMISKPVAWKYSVNDAHLMFSISEPPDDAYDEGTLIPLYTHPVKQLSDEKIEKIYWNMESSVLTKEGVVDFARAIIKEITE